MRVELTTRVELDGAEFTFGTADKELVWALEALGAALPIMLPAMYGMDWEEIGKLSEEEIERRGKEAPLQPEHLPAAVKESFCSLFVEAIRGWRGVEDAAGDRIDCDEQARRDFPTDQKVAVVCEYINERKRVESKEPRPGELVSN